jgi:uncharacterized membrane protein YgdD (TMEM256/DUF423 family)
MNTQKFWIIISAVSGFLGVAFGAFGAHYLKSQLSPEMLEIFKTGVFYQLIHSIVLLAVSFIGEKIYLKSNKFFLGGIMIFSFSLYLYSLTSVKFFAMLTPIGGVLFLTGWIFLIITALKKKDY